MYCIIKISAGKGSAAKRGEGGGTKIEGGQFNCEKGRRLSNTEIHLFTLSLKPICPKAFRKYRCASSVAL